MPEQKSNVKASGHWLISTQVSKDGGDLAGVRPATLTDALYSLDQAYADAGTKGKHVFRKETKNDNGLWGVVLYEDRMLNGHDPRRDAAIVGYYKKWLPPWPPQSHLPSSRSTRKRKRS